MLPGDVVVSSITSVEYHRERFVQLASELEGPTARCYFSFPTFYGKVIRNTAALERETGVTCLDLPMAQKVELAAEMAEVAAGHGITMFTCCNDALVSGRISRNPGVGVRPL
jgi:hypothetical protein